MSGTLRQRVRDGVRGLAPGYFALVMASGILSVGLQLQGFPVLSAVLLAVCAGGWAVLCLLTVWRFAAFRRELLVEFLDPRRAFGFFTFVAGTNVLAARLATTGWHGATAVLLGLAGAVWLVLGYVVPWTAVLSRRTRPVVSTANGTWFIWVVASQSVAVAAAALDPVVADGTARHALSVVAVVCWSVGLFLYASAGVLVTLRMMLYPLRPVDLTPPYWVAMGACAITVLAASRIVEMSDTPMVAVVRGLVAGLGVVFWAFATWLIPALVAAGWWRHRVHRVPLRYESSLWSVVFPLGMYAVASIYLGRADGLPIVGLVGAAWLWVALGAWAVVFTAMLVHLVRRLLLGRQVPAPVWPGPDPAGDPDTTGRSGPVGGADTAGRSGPAGGADTAGSPDPAGGPDTAR